mgnify:CR=1 FL=1
MSSPLELRIGQGIDVHQLVEGRHCIIGGVKIQHTHGLDGHSDADVLLHAVMDAVLGAVGASDIGTLFPPDDERWRGADSLELLRSVWSKVSSEGWRLVNLDCTVLAEAPKIYPHVPMMKDKISSAFGVATNCIGIKATTTESMGFVGRREGILASAAILLSRGG